jgi:hypothetical protein
MPYVFAKERCPCGSNASLFECHLRDEATQNYPDRVVFLTKKIASLQGDDYATACFRSPGYAKVREAPDVLLGPMRDLAATSIKSDMNLHKALSTFNTPKEIPPSVLVFAPRTFNVPVEGGAPIILEEGIYEFHGKRLVQGGDGKIFSEMRIRAYAGGVYVGGESAPELEVPDDLLWIGLSEKLLVVRSALVYSHEIVRHSAS